MLSFADKLLFFGESSSVELSVPGPFVQPINLSIEQSAVGVHLSVDVDAVHDVSVLKWLDITKPPGTLPALLKKAPTTCLHHGSLGAVLFPVGAAESPVTQELINHKCAIANCGVVLGDAHAAIGHSSYHMLHTPTLVPNSESCPLCLGPADMCPAYLIKTGSSYLQPRLLCQIFSPGSTPGDPTTGVKLTAAAMSKSTQNTPSTNAPIICPACEPISANPEHLNQSTSMSKGKVKKNCVAVMKYNMRVHWNILHSTDLINK